MKYHIYTMEYYASFKSEDVPTFSYKKKSLLNIE